MSLLVLLPITSILDALPRAWPCPYTFLQHTGQTFHWYVGGNQSTQRKPQWNTHAQGTCKLYGDSTKGLERTWVARALRQQFYYSTEPSMGTVSLYLLCLDLNISALNILAGFWQSDFWTLFDSCCTLTLLPRLAAKSWQFCHLMTAVALGEKITGAAETF